MSYLIISATALLLSKISRQQRREQSSKPDEAFISQQCRKCWLGQACTLLHKAAAVAADAWNDVVVVVVVAEGEADADAAVVGDAAGATAAVDGRMESRAPPRKVGAGAEAAAAWVGSRAAIAAAEVRTCSVGLDCMVLPSATK